MVRAAIREPRRNGRASRDRSLSNAAYRRLKRSIIRCEVIARASGNPRLAQSVEQLLEESERLFHLGLMLRNRTSEMAHEHRELVSTLAAGDGEAARKVAVRQIVESQRMVMDALIASPAVLSAPVAIPLAATARTTKPPPRRAKPRRR